MKESIQFNKEINNISKPDVAIDETVSFPSTLQKVGMSNVELPIIINNGEKLLTLPAKCDLFVSLDDPHIKGIHMSRLFLKAQEFFEENELTISSVETLLKKLLTTHSDVAYSAYVNIAFDYIVKRQALISNEKGWRSYPVTFKGKIEKNNVVLDTNFRITYSSTCPCSAALSRQMIQEGFLEAFSTKNINLKDIYAWLGKEESQKATPHSQRSYADITVRFKQPTDALHINCLIDMVEATISTPVQAAVKRDDEQEFARLNGSNFMFSEDAARKIKTLLDIEEKISDYKIHIQHLESLHPHDAVVITTKGIPGGFIS